MTISNPPGSNPANPIRKPGLLTTAEAEKLREYITSSKHSDERIIGQIQNRFFDLVTSEFVDYYRAHYAPTPVLQSIEVTNPVDPRSNKTHWARQQALQPTPSAPTQKARFRKMTVPQDVEATKPRCPDHDVEMEFDPPSGAWHCIEFQCKRKMIRIESILDAKGRVISGEIKLYSTGAGSDEQYYLYLPAYRMFIDLKNVLHRDGTGSMHASGTPPKFHLGLVFDRLNAQADSEQG